MGNNYFLSINLFLSLDKNTIGDDLNLIEMNPHLPQHKQEKETKQDVDVIYMLFQVYKIYNIFLNMFENLVFTSLKILIEIRKPKDFAE